MSSTSAAAALRVAGTAIGLYDFIMTIHLEVSYYRTQYNNRGWGMLLRPFCFLFIMTRYTGLINICVTLIGFFGHFSPTSCDHFFLLAPLFRIFLGLSSSGIMAYCTFTLWRFSRPIGIGLILALLAMIVVDAVSISRDGPVQDFSVNNCYSQASLQKANIKWIFYAYSMLFDIVTTVLSTMRLYKDSAGNMQGFSKIVVRDGMLYFVVITFFNAINMFFLLQPVQRLRSSLQALGVSATLIFGQRIVLHLHSTNKENSATASIPPPQDSQIQRRISTFSDGSVDKKRTFLPSRMRRHSTHLTQEEEEDIFRGRRRPSVSSTINSQSQPSSPALAMTPRVKSQIAESVSEDEREYANSREDV